MADHSRVFGVDMANRVFLVDPEDLSVKMCQTKPLLPTDRVFLLSTKLDYPKLTGKVHNFLDGKTTFCQITEASDIMALVIAECVNEEDIYFIGNRMDKYYKECKEAVIENGHKIGKNRSFGVAKTLLRGRETQQTLAGFMGDMASALNTQPEIAGASKEVGTVKTPGEAEPPEVEEKKDKVEDKESPTTTTAEDQPKQASRRPDREPAPKRETRKQRDTKAKKDGMTAEQKPEESIHMLEAEIFGSSDLSGEKETTDNRISDAKATLTYAMLERLSKHIIELTRKSFDQGECYKFVLLLRKTDSPEEFEGSWKTVFSDPSFRILPDTYWYLRNEATYYHKVCAVLYEEDIWTT